MITARPLLMAAPMVRSTIEGIKTQTRRIVKPQPFLDAMGNFCTPGKPGRPYSCWGQHIDGSPCTRNFTKSRCPHGVQGNLLYVKETWAVGKCADGLKPRELSRGCWIYENGGLWYEGQEPTHPISPRGAPRSSLVMPRWASRLTLEITDVRVERLQDMEGQHPSESDAIAEGVNKIHHGDGAYYYSAFRNEPHPKNWCDPTDAFRELWEKLNGKGSWDANPWVWVLTFKVHHANVDAVLAMRAEVLA